MRENFVGLTSDEAARRLKEYGPNILPEKPPPSSVLILLDQLKSPLVYILLIAAIVTFLLGHFSDMTIILLAVFLNTILGFYQEQKAKKALHALTKVLTPQTRVIRDGEKKMVAASQLVPGDLVSLETGDKIPADGVLIEVVDLAVNEAMLTGESQSVVKKENDLGFMGTMVVAGRGMIQLKKTGSFTRMGEIATSLKEKEEKTPLEKRLGLLAKNLAILVGLAAVFIFVSGILAGKSTIEMFTTAVALAVAAIPEGLLVSLTVILAIGMQRILKRKALVRNLTSAETLGSVTVICADKTGTLTEGKFKVVSWEVVDDNLAFKLAVLCNNLTDPEEKALWDFVMTKDHFDPQRIREENPRIREIPFSSKNKFMATVHKMIDNYTQTAQNFLFVKGAPEKILEMSKISSLLRQDWEEKSERWASRGERVFGLAYREVQSTRWRKGLKVQNELKDLTFLGLVGFSDPPRKEAGEVLRIIQGAGVKLKVLTGDFRVTAETILRQIGLEVKPEEILEGEEVKHFTNEELRSRISQIKLFTRVDPLDKLRIVKVLQENGEVVALVGDGVNDAPALKRAEVGVVVGEASEVAKETADIVLLDSNLGTLVSAIEEGRGIFTNLRKIILYLLADAFGELVVIFGALVAVLPLPLAAGQILWINLVSDGFPALALTVDPPKEGIMKEPPMNPKENLLNLEIKALIFLVSLFAGLSSLLIFFLFLSKTGDVIFARSLSFAILGTNSLFYVFSCRSLRQPVWRSNIFSNLWLVLGVGAGFFLLVSAFYFPPLVSVLGTVPLGIFEWGLVAATGLAVVILIESIKFVFVLKSRR